MSVAAGQERSVSPDAGLRWALLATLLATLLVAALSYQRGGMVVQGLVAGLGYGLSAVFVRVTMQLSGAGTSWLVIPELYLALLAGGCGVVMYARALEHQRVRPPTALLWVVEVVGPGTLGLLALGDTIRSGWVPAAALGVAAAVAGCVLLAMSPSQQEAGA